MYVRLFVVRVSKKKCESQITDKNATNLDAYLSRLHKVEFEEFKMNEKEENEKKMGKIDVY